MRGSNILYPAHKSVTDKHTRVYVLCIQDSFVCTCMYTMYFYGIMVEVFSSVTIQCLALRRSAISPRIVGISYMRKQSRPPISMYLRNYGNRYRYIGGYIPVCPSNALVPGCSYKYAAHIMRSSERVVGRCQSLHELQVPSCPSSAHSLLSVLNRCSWAYSSHGLPGSSLSGRSI